MPGPEETAGIPIVFTYRGRFMCSSSAYFLTLPANAYVALVTAYQIFAVRLLKQLPVLDAKWKTRKIPNTEHSPATSAVKLPSIPRITRHHVFCTRSTHLANLLIKAVK